MTENKITQWPNCYDSGWKDLIVPEAFSHPAKMSYGLLKRILEHAKGWLNEGDVILDPFGGIGSTGILGAYEGYQVVCCELEQKFVDLAEQNFEMHKDAWVEFGNPFPIILQGDSRRLCEVVEKADCIVSSPPYIENLAGGGEAMQPRPGDVRKSRRVMTHDETYGQTPGQLGAMKSGKAEMVVSSPPYEGSMTTAETKNYAGNTQVTTKYQRSYGNNKENIGNQQGDTFWQAAKTIVEQCHQILKPGGHAIWVVKSFVRKKKIVDFPGDWQRLCESVGFKTVCIHHAMLVKETSHKTLFGHTETKRKERKSFFRRLAESKGSPRIDYEVVLYMVKQPLFPMETKK